jgi:hypothetical protein
MVLSILSVLNAFVKAHSAGFVEIRFSGSIDSELFWKGHCGRPRTQLQASPYFLVPAFKQFLHFRLQPLRNRRL